MPTQLRNPTATTTQRNDGDQTADSDLSIVCAVSSIGLWLTCLVTVAVSASALGLVLVLLAGVGIAGNAWRLITKR
ncbi:MAG: hypothetical protein K0R27_4203 [Xanthobacteraceae bacterium]|jgi:hypothetical protein|nr:hypothetical protein [Xanthobacteraceae bacterium]